MKATRTTTTKLLLIATVVCLVLSIASCGLLGGSLELKSFTVDRSTVKTVYIVGDEIDFSGIKATAVYTDESLNKVYTFNELTITFDEDITATPGQKTVKVSFLDPNLNVTQETTVQITVNEDPFAVKHASYRIDASAVKTGYNIGETIDFSGIKLYERFSDGSEVEITDLAGLSYSPALDTLTATTGNKSVKVQYNGEDAGAITVKVIDPEEEKNHVLTVTLGGNYKTTYEVGETIDLTGMTVTVTYEEGEVMVLTHDSLTAESVDMSITGTKTVVITFRDPINNEEDFESFSITVVHKDEVVQFEKPQNISNFENDNKTAGALKYGETGFQGQFLVGGKTYVVGNDNPFDFVPKFAIEENGIPKTLLTFHTNVDLYLLVDGEYVLLSKTADATNPALFTYTTADGAVIASVDTYRGSYQFGDAAQDKQIKLSVLPSTDYYKLGNTSPITLEVKVIDAYNVYEAWQLAVIDNDPARGDWTTFKEEHGILGFAPAGVVFHSDIHISANDVPASFFYVTTTETVYTNTTDSTTKTAPVGTRYLQDGAEVYRRVGGADFVIEGNFFTLDTQNFPLVPSDAVFGKESGYGYGEDFSNSTLFVFSTNYNLREAVPNDRAYTDMKNLHIVGNAGRNNYVDANGDLASAGGLIFAKSRGYSIASFDNMIGNAFFIAYFPDYESDVTMTNIKFYDSYQNAMMCWGDTKCTLDNAYFNGAGGPLVICQSALLGDNVTWITPVLNATNFTAETHLTGEEIWFTAVNATTVIGDIKALGQGLHYKAGLGDFVDSNGKMNIVGLLMASGSDATAIIGGFDAQGEMVFNGEGIERWQTDPELWGIVYNHPAFKQLAPFLTVYGDDGTAYTIFFDGTTFRDLMGNELGTDASHVALVNAFKTADRITLSQGGISVVLEFYH